MNSKQVVLITGVLSLGSPIVITFGPFDISLCAIAGVHRSRVSSPSNGGSQCAF